MDPCGSGFSFGVEVAGFRGAARRPRRAKTKKSPVRVVSKALAFLPNGHFPYGQLVRPPRARKDAHTCRWAWTEKRAVLGVSRRGDQCILFALPVRARQVAEPDLEGRSTGRSDTSFAAADARYGRGRPGDARGACLGGATDASRLFSPAKNDGRLTQWQSATNRGKAQSNQPRTFNATFVRTNVQVMY